MSSSNSNMSCWPTSARYPGYWVNKMPDVQEPWGDSIQNCSNSSNSPEVSILLEGELNIIHDKHSIPVHLLVTSHYLKYAPIGKDNHIAGKEIVIDWGHVIGCHCLRGKVESSKKNAYFSIYIYAPKNVRLSTSRKPAVLKRCVLTFEVTGQADNMKLAKEYQSVILSCIHMSNAAPFKDKKPYLVLVNPRSGPGKAYQIFTNIVNPIFSEADIPYELLVTEHPQHASEYMRTLDINLYKGVVVVSGDGLVHEVINGLFSRPNWQEVLKSCPIGIVAAGSGNALAASLCHSSGLSAMESIETHTALILVSPRIHPMDLVVVETSSGKQLLSFLSVSWGLVANVDIESERWRSLGNARFTLAALGLILKHRSYPATLSFLPHDDGPYRFNRQRINTMPSIFSHTNSQQHRLSCQIDTDPTNTTENHAPRPPMFRSESLPPLSSQHRSSISKTDRKISQHQSIDENNSMSIPDELEEVFAEEDSKQIDQSLEDKRHDNKEVSRTQGVPDNESNGVEDKLATINPTSLDSNAHELTGQNAYNLKYCSPLNSPVPANWQTLTDDFVTVVALYMSHLSTDAMVVRQSTITDGIIYLLVVRRGIKRNQLIQLFSKMEQGENIENSHIDIIPVKAFRLSPGPSSNSVMAVDGERVDYGDIQAEILPSAGCVLDGPDIANNEGINGPLLGPILTDSLKDLKQSRSTSLQTN